MSVQDLLGSDLDSDSDSSQEQSPSEPQILEKQPQHLKQSSISSEEEGEIHSDEEASKQLPIKINSSGPVPNVSCPDKEAAIVKELFGESDHSSHGDDQDGSMRPPAMNTAQNSASVPNVDDVFADGDQEPEAPPPPAYLDVEIPKCSANLGSELYFVKLPNFLSVEPRPFDSALYEDEIDEDEMMDEEGRTRLKLKVENTIRWRVAKDENGDDIKESNARVVRWSDGSLSLLLGNEVFDIHKQQLLNSDHSHLFVRQGTGLQAQAVFRTKLTFRPHSTDSITHRKMTLSMADKFNKTQKIRVLPVIGKDPETQRTEMAKKEEERQRATTRRESKQRRLREKAASRGLSARFLEPDQEDDEDPDSLSAIKSSFKHGGKGYKKAQHAADLESFGTDNEDNDGGSERDELEQDLEQARKLTNAKEDEPNQRSIPSRRRALDEVASGGSGAKKRRHVNKRIVESDDNESG